MALFNKMTMKRAFDDDEMVTATLDEELEWSIESTIETPTKSQRAVLRNRLLDLKAATKELLADLSPADGDPQSVVIEHAAESFGYTLDAGNKADKTPKNRVF